MKRSRPNFWLVILGVALAVNLVVGYQVYSKETAGSGEKEAFEKMAIMMQVLHLIRQDYVDADKAKYTELIYNATRGMVGTLDPFSDFLTPKEYKEMLEITEGKFGGLGITITVRGGVLTVVSPIEGSPAAKAGILPGDQIAKIEQTATKDMDMSEAVNRLKGNPGTKVSLTVFRPSSQQNLALTLERAVIDVPTVTEAQMLDHTIGYLRITEFSDPTADRLRDALAKLQKEKLQGLIVDLRNNPGGLLESAVEVCSSFLPAKSPVVSTEGRRVSQRQQWFTDSRPKLGVDVPIAILINQGSASAAEIVAGCLQDYGRAILVGEKSFGKGSVQNLIELADGSALRLTTAKYYTPSHRIIHEHGIAPDIAVPMSEDEMKRLLLEQDQTAVKRPNVASDRQLQRAVEVLKSYDAFQAAKQARFKKLRAP